MHGPCCEERDGWLEQHCGDPALRERVLRLLRAHDSAQERGALETIAARARRAASAAST